MQKFELAHEPTEGPVYGAGGVIVDRVEKGVWNDGKVKDTFLGHVARHGLLYYFEVGDIVWREDLAFLPVGSILAEDGEDPLSKHSDRKWYSGSERIPEEAEEPWAVVRICPRGEGERALAACYIDGSLSHHRETVINVQLPNKFDMELVLAQSEYVLGPGRHGRKK